MIVAVLVRDADGDDVGAGLVRRAARVAHVRVEAHSDVIARVNVKVIERHSTIVDRRRTAAVTAVADVERTVDVIRSIWLCRVADFGFVAGFWISDRHRDVIVAIAFVERNVDNRCAGCVVIVGAVRVVGDVSKVAVAQHDVNDLEAVEGQADAGRRRNRRGADPDRLAVTQTKIARTCTVM